MYINIKNINKAHISQVEIIIETWVNIFLVSIFLLIKKG